MHGVDEKAVDLDYVVLRLSYNRAVMTLSFQTTLIFHYLGVQDYLPNYAVYFNHFYALFIHLQPRVSFKRDTAAPKLRAGKMSCRSS
jgi:hypothetical protein